jgi:diguanylate cyclase
MRLKDSIATSQEDFSQTLRYARSALNLLSDLRVPPTPIRFAVVYWHQTGTRPDLSLALNRLVAHDSLTGVALDELHEQFFGEDKEQSVIRQASENIEASIIDVTKSMSEAQTAAQQFDFLLKNFTTELGAAATPEIDSAVQSMIAGTQQMVDANRQVEDRLQFTLREIELLRERLDQLEHDVIQDPLTGIGNRKRFDTAIRELMSRSLLSQEPLTLLMVDVDHFKKFNDEHGHLVGDQVLKLVARQLTSATTEADVAARYGGEEFGVILPRTPLLVGVKLADKIRAAVSDRKVVNRRTGHAIGHVTLSVGAALYRPGETAAELIHRADEALYLAKDDGRNRVKSENDLPVVV